jgi:hypothetical protein
MGKGLVLDRNIDLVSVICTLQAYYKYTGRMTNMYLLVYDRGPSGTSEY